MTVFYPSDIPFTRPTRDRRWPAAFLRRAWRAIAHFVDHLKHGSDGGLLHGPHGNLIHACSTPGCPCAAEPPCSYCPIDPTPTQFHVTFTGVTLCTGCVDCAEYGFSQSINAGSVLNGTYLITRNGLCAWTAFANLVPVNATAYTTEDCTGSSTAVTYAVQQVRINATQFLLQVVDSNLVTVLFNAVIDSTKCCVSYTVANGLTTCGCTGTSPFALGTGGFATVTPC